MQLVPNSAGSRLVEFNPCHTPAGTSAGGQFCSDRDAFVPVVRASPMDVLTKPYGEHAAMVREIGHRLRAKMAKDGNEHAVVFHPDRHPEFFTSNDPKQVRMPRDDFVTDMQANPPLVSAHTHPSGSAPSLPDLKLQIRTKSAKQIIFGPGDEWYEITVTDFKAANRAFETGLAGKPVRTATFWEEATKSGVQVFFDRQRTQVKNDAILLTDRWAAKRFNLVIEKGPPHQPPAAQVAGFRQPNGSWISRKEAGARHPEIRTHFTRTFSDLSPRIWQKMREKYAAWLQFRYHRTTGPHAETPTD